MIRNSQILRRHEIHEEGAKENGEKSLSCHSDEGGISQKFMIFFTSRADPSYLGMTIQCGLRNVDCGLRIVWTRSPFRGQGSSEGQTHTQHHVTNRMRNMETLTRNFLLLNRITRNQQLITDKFNY